MTADAKFDRLIRQMGGAWIGRYRAAIPTPGHSAHDRGTVISIAREFPDGFLVHSFNGGDDVEIKRQLLSFLGHDEAITSWGQRDVVETPDVNSKVALRIWERTVPAQKTPVERYLACRGLVLLPDVTDIRFHPNCPFASERHPAMVCAMRDIFTDEVVAVHRTALQADGSGKAKLASGHSPKMMLGPVANAVVKLSPDADVAAGLAISEGIENALTALCAGWGPAWAAGSAGALERFTVLSGIEHLTIFADPEPVGMNAARACARRWQFAGTDVTLARPHGDADWNEAVRRGP